MTIIIGLIMFLVGMIISDKLFCKPMLESSDKIIEIQGEILKEQSEYILLLKNEIKKLANN